ncbi:MAG TPA: preprotein translocase subunit SecA [Casimicrobiaceae bacterium]|jgi:preprotein translocase subunit SecA|nr:preprotein translocase subunit SecA [Casimicrobiaceae bacterium]
MISNILTKVFGSRNERLLKQYGQGVRQINALEPAISALSDAELRAKTVTLRERVGNGESLDAVLPEAFAIVREAGKRTLQMRHFDVQLIGGMALHYGKIAEMRTGEGKTLVATLPAYLNALAGRGMHIVTVNDYLAQRDADWMGRIYRFLGLTVGVNLSQMSHPDKQVAYAADITYGTNNEFGFDYLRDNMVFQASERVQRGLNYAIVDEVDSILIDEARTPLIISGQADDNVELYYRLNELAPKLQRQTEEQGAGDYWVDEKAHQVLLSEAGHERAENILTDAGLLPVGTSLYNAHNISLVHHLYAALRAHALFHRDQHYVVQNGEVIIVDEFTGRLMAGRRWSDGLHQAVEAKEGVPIQRENQTLASITFQNYFRMYERLAGMTGTADTEAFEFQQIYHLETVVIPTHLQMVREDENDLVFRTLQEKIDAIIGDIKECYRVGQPVLVGTTSIENSELLSGYLEKQKLPHQVLNAKQHAREAEIVAQAGRPKMVTIATNMAGRGTDIVLGGSVEPHILAIRENEALPQAERDLQIGKLRSEWQVRHDAVIAAGGLHIVGTERHESRRIDNQLRGRAGRQGDPGSSRFFLSLEDPLLRIFGGERLSGIMQRLKMPEGEPIEHSIVNRSIAKAQNRVESRNFDLRKQLLEYDDVANDQRRVIYQQRNELLETEDVSDTIRNMIAGQIDGTARLYVPPESVEEQWDIAGLEGALAAQYEIKADLAEWIKAEPELGDDALRERVRGLALQQYEKKLSQVGPELFHPFERNLMLQMVDQHWREHLSALDHLRQGIHLRGYAQKNPKQEYKREAFELFSDMLDRIKEDVVKYVLTVQVGSPQDVQVVEEAPAVSNVRYQHADYDEALAAASSAAPAAVAPPPFTRVGQKVGRNDPCPCGSGKKYKHCHGRI